MGKRTGGKARAPTKLITDLPTPIDPSFAEKLELKIVEHTTSSWEYGFGKLEQFVAREGHAGVPTSYTDPEDGFRLGTWVIIQRLRKGKGKRSSDQIARLESLPGWDWNADDAAWESGFDHLKKFVEIHGHVRVPKTYSDPEDGYKTGTWIDRQRHKGKRSPEQITRLESLPGWKWALRPRRLNENAAWEVGFDHLRKFVEIHGHARVPQDYSDPEDGYTTGTWVSTRRLHKGKGKLSPEQITQLESVPGWVWNRMDDRWESGFDHLKKFVEIHGHASVPRTYSDPEDGYKTGIWVNNQRREKLSPERIAMLESILGWTWDASGDRWGSGLDHLKRYKKINGDANVPAAYIDPEDGYTTGRWASHQRGAKKNGKLSPEQIAQLQSVPGWTWKAKPGRPRKAA